jgi:hypothetical protein
MAEFAVLVDGVADDLASAFHATKGQVRSVKITLRHALLFPAWADLQAQGTGNRRKVKLVATWLDGQVHLFSNWLIHPTVRLHFLRQAHHSHSCRP